MLKIPHFPHCTGLSAPCTKRLRFVFKVILTIEKTVHFWAILKIEKRSLVL